MKPDSKIRADLFVTCLVDQLFPEVGVSVVKVLRQLGVEVSFPPDQTCCGQPVFNSGFKEEGRKLALRMLQSFHPHEEDGSTRYIVVPSGSCAAMMKVFYSDLFRDDPTLQERARALSSRVYEFSEFLVKILGVTDVGARFNGKITYHPSCHLLRELQVSAEPIKLLDNVEGAERVELAEAETCCGFGGTFSVKYPHISESMLEDKVQNIVSSGAQTLVSCDMSCLMHIGGALSRRRVAVEPLHLAQVLDHKGPF